MSRALEALLAATAASWIGCGSRPASVTSTDGGCARAGAWPLRCAVRCEAPWRAPWSELPWEAIRTAITIASRVPAAAAARLRLTLRRRDAARSRLARSARAVIPLGVDDGRVVGAAARSDRDEVHSVGSVEVA